MLLAVLMKKEVFDEKADTFPDTAANVAGKKKSKRDRDNVRLICSVVSVTSQPVESGILSSCYILCNSSLNLQNTAITQHTPLKKTLTRYRHILQTLAEEPGVEASTGCQAFTPGPKALKVGILKVMLACLTSISPSLGEERASYLLLLKYFTPDAVKARFEMLSEESSCSEDSPETALLAAEMVPLFLQIVTVVWGARGEEDSVDGGLDSYDVLLHYIKASNTVYSPSSGAIHSAATVGAITALGREDILLEAIHSSLKDYQAAVSNSSILLS
jgi:hypothetical protein